MERREPSSPVAAVGKKGVTVDVAVGAAVAKTGAAADRNDPLKSHGCENAEDDRKPETAAKSTFFRVRKFRMRHSVDIAIGRSGRTGRQSIAATAKIG